MFVVPIVITNTCWLFPVEAAGSVLPVMKKRSSSSGKYSLSSATPSVRLQHSHYLAQTFFV